jgi:hemerythrin-like metal-binding protein
MGLIVWNESFSIGVAVIDREHEILIGLINQLYRNVELQEDPRKLLALIGSLIDYSQYHFADEEEMLQAAQYPGYNEQRRAHKEFTLKIVEYRDRYESNWESLIPELFDYLKGWWTQHIKVLDMAYAAYMIRNPGSDAAELGGK